MKYQQKNIKICLNNINKRKQINKKKKYYNLKNLEKERQLLKNKKN